MADCIGKEWYDKMKQKMERIHAFLKKEAEGCISRAAELKADHRVDEANFERIRANVFEIFYTVLQTAQKVCEDDAAAFSFFLKKTEEIPRNWAVQYEKAKRYGDVKNEKTEEIKLAAMQQIRAHLEESGGDVE